MSSGAGPPQQPKPALTSRSARRKVCGRKVSGTSAHGMGCQMDRSCWGGGGHRGQEGSAKNGGQGCAHGNGFLKARFSGQPTLRSD
jgi:hypothetical protein